MIIAVEGNIGAGKTTFLKEISRYAPHLAIHFEPVEQWQKQGGKSLLGAFYENQSRWSYTMETWTLLCRVKELLSLEAKKLTLLERSIYSGFHCFAKNGFHTGVMNQTEWNLYQQWYQFLTQQTGFQAPDAFIYLRTTPHTTFQRLLQRGRVDEDKVNFSYIKQIHEMHEQLLIDKIDIEPALQQVPVITLDANQEFENNELLMREWIASLPTLHAS